MQFSSRLPIAVHILLCIQQFDGQYKVTSNFLAGSVNVNPVIIRKTLGQLKTAGLVNIEAGVGGASLARSAEDITLLDIFYAVEQQEDLFHFHENPNPNCPVGRNIHAVLGKQLLHVQKTMLEQLAAITLQSLIDDIDTSL